MDNTLEEFVNAFSKIVKHPHDFLSVQEEVAENVKVLIKQLYDYTKADEKDHYKNTLPKLIVQGFDEEQIWQELELQNGSFSDGVIQIVSRLSSKKDKLNFPFKLKCIPKEAKEILSNTIVENEEEEGKEIEDSDFEYDEEDDKISDFGDDGTSEEETSPVKKGKLKPSIVDDKFFKLSELELFLQSEEKNEEKPGREKETLDLFTNSDEEEAADYKYSDFFENPEGEPSEKEKDDQLENSEGGSDDGEEENDKKLSANKNKRKHTESNDDELNTDDQEGEDREKDPSKKKKKVRFSLLNSDKEESSSGDDSDNKPKDLFGTKKSDKQSDKTKSTLEQRQERLGRMIEKLEDEALSKKPWQLSGEVSANTRPQNSLLEEAVDFDISVRPAPVMTGEVTLKLEDIIIQRIKDKVWDDVERKVKPVETPSEFKRKLALDQEKSKLSLAEVYEKEFIKQREAATADDTEKQEVEPPLHVEVRSMLSSLFNKLDALSNYHYTPRPVAPELKVISNVAAISMEEVAPVSVADSALLAPQEIKRKKQNSELMSKEERTTTDKKRARRIKKTRQRRRQREKERAAKEIAKINPGSQLKAQEQVWNVTSSNVTKMDESKDKVVKSSTSFFNKLQDEVKSTIKSKTSSFAKKNEKKKVTAKKLKL